MANESFSFEEAIGLTPKPQPSGAADPGGFSFEEALGKPAQASPGFIPTIKRTGGQMLTTAATAAEDVVGCPCRRFACMPPSLSWDGIDAA